MSMNRIPLKSSSDSFGSKNSIILVKYLLKGKVHYNNNINLILFWKPSKVIFRGALWLILKFITTTSVAKISVQTLSVSSLPISYLNLGVLWNQFLFLWDHLNSPIDMNLWSPIYKAFRVESSSKSPNPFDDPWKPQKINKHCQEEALLSLSVCRWE